MPVSPEMDLVSSVITNGDIKTAFAHGVSKEMFHTCQDEWEWVENFWRRYNRLPKKAAFMRAFPDFRFRRNATDTDHYADEVRVGHARHVMTEVLQEAADALAGRDIDKALAVITKSVVQVSAAMGTTSDEDIFSSYTEILQDVKGRVQRAEADGQAGIPFGFDTVDDLTGGANPGELVVIAARLGEGKSWMMQSYASHAASKGFRVQFDALEQTRAQVGMRIHTLLSGTAGRKLFKTTSLMRGKDFDYEDYEDFLSELKKSIQGAMHVADTSRGSISTMTIASQIERNKPDVVYVDYITLLKMAGDKNWMTIGQTSTELKQIAQRYGVGMVAAAQLNRAEGAGKGEPPGPEAIGGADGIGQDADVVITQRQRTPSVIQQKMAKNRNGPGGSLWWIQFQPGKGIIKEVSANTADKLMDADAEAADADYDRRSRRS